MKFLRGPIVFIFVAIGVIAICSCTKKKTTDESSKTHYGYHIGMNLDYSSPWTTHIMFANVFKQAKHWEAYQLGTTTWSTNIDDVPIPLNGQGYPSVTIPYDHDNNSSTGGFVVHTVVLFAIGNNYPSGNYTLKFSGQGKVSVNWDAGEHPERGYSAWARTYESTGGEVTNSFPVEPNIGIKVQIEESNSSNPVRDIQLLLPGYENSATTNIYHPFYAPFITGLQGFKVIRTMNMVLTNEVSCDNPNHISSNRTAYKNCVISWDNRVTDYYTFSINGRGIPWEYAIDLVNAVDGADIWINVPHAATDDYIRQLATLLHTRLKSDRSIYVEYSNEIWNTADGFPQHMWFQDNGQSIFPNDSLVVAGAKYYVRGLVNIFSIFEQVFSGEESRLIRVLASQQGNTQKTIDLLSYLENTPYTPVKNGKIDAVAIGAYFGWSVLSNSSGSYVPPSVETLLANASNDIAGIGISAAEATQAINNYKTRTNTTNDILLLAYEGGSHLSPVTENWSFIGMAGNAENFDFTNYVTASKSAQMYDLYLKMGNAWFGNGGDLLLAFSYVSKHHAKYTNRSGEQINIGTGLFGHLETPDESLSTAPKYRALKDMMY